VKFPDGRPVLSNPTPRREEIPGSNASATLTRAQRTILVQVLSVGKQICIDDGLISLTVKEIKGADVVCVVNNTAMLGETKVCAPTHLFM
jgi:pyruvate kinase